jgi:hypothetical protein
MELGERGKGKENDRASVKLHNIRWESVIRMCIESCQKMGGGR